MGQGPLPRYLCPRGQVFQPYCLALAMHARCCLRWLARVRAHPPLVEAIQAAEVDQIILGIRDVGFGSGNVLVARRATETLHTCMLAGLGHGKPFPFYKGRALFGLFAGLEAKTTPDFVHRATFRRDPSRSP